MSANQIADVHAVVQTVRSAFSEMVRPIPAERAVSLKADCMTAQRPHSLDDNAACT